jgi:hypothetical protein
LKIDNERAVLKVNRENDVLGSFGAREKSLKSDINCGDVCAVLFGEDAVVGEALMVFDVDDV